jgi:predicted AAA+ superfamily ATPase
MHHGSKEQVFYFRTNLGIEVDLIIDDPAKNILQLVEIKSTETARSEMFQNILKVRELEGKDQKRKKQIKSLLIYRGDTFKEFREGCGCINYFDCFNAKSALSLFEK